MNKLVKLLKDHVSKDDTRYHLTGAYFHEGKAIATDGHRMVLISVENDAELSKLSELRNGQIHDFNNPLTPIDGKYPHYKQVVPHDYKNWNCFAFEFPEWMSKIKTKRNEAKAIFLDVHGFHLSKPQGDYVAFNVEYLAPYAGNDCKIYFRDKLTPMVIENENWTAIVMPMRV